MGLELRPFLASTRAAPRSLRRAAGVAWHIAFSAFTSAFGRRSSRHLSLSRRLSSHVALLSVALAVAFLGPSESFEKGLLGVAGRRVQPDLAPARPTVPAGELPDALLRELRSPSTRGGGPRAAGRTLQGDAPPAVTPTVRAASERHQSPRAADVLASADSPDLSALAADPAATPPSGRQDDPAGQSVEAASEPEASSEQIDAAATVDVSYAVDPNPVHWAFLQAAVGPAQDSQRETGVPASVTIAQAIHESAWGTSRLSREANNYFGIKANGKPGSRGVVVMSTGEFLNGASVTVKDAFRAYGDMAESFVDHGRFLQENARYAKVMANAQDPRTFIRLIAQAGYATDPAYARKVLAYMDRYDLYQYDLN